MVMTRVKNTFTIVEFQVASVLQVVDAPNLLNENCYVFQNSFI